MASIIGELSCTLDYLEGGSSKPASFRIRISKKLAPGKAVFTVDMD